VDIVVDRLKVKPDMQQRLAESFETALRHSDGRAIAVDLDQNTEHLFSSTFACPICSFSIQELEPRLFSFNNPMGACPKCDGLGEISFFDAKRVVAFPQLSLAGGAIKGWDKRNQFYFQWLTDLSKHYHFKLDTPFEELEESIQHLLLFGSGKEKITFHYPGDKGRLRSQQHPFEGIIPILDRRYKETDSMAVREELAKLLNDKPCPDCQGSRLRIEAREVRINQYTLHQISALPLRETLSLFQQLTLKGKKQAIADKILKEIIARLQFLNNVGLEYLQLERSADTLSGGEAQRIRLASQIGSGLTGVMYVLDEPSIGLHQRDNHRLLETLNRLRDLGNSVIVVEHDEDAIRAADFVVDMGPGAGEHGGEVVAKGTPQDIENSPHSLTGEYLKGSKAIAVPEQRHQPDERRLIIRGAQGNNLKKVNLELPVGLFIAITGVSGSGKSTLINDTLYHAVSRHLYHSSTEPAPFEGIQGLEHFDKIINVDQSPIGRTPRSNPATYTGLFTPIRELFAGIPQSRERGYGPGRFSFNVKGGRCEACQGEGMVRVEMHFLPDIYVPCDVCHGKRYNRETLEIHYKGKSIDEVLALTVEKALEFFNAVPIIARKCQTLMDVGLGYITLGQSATTLSGGEAQRVKLSLELSKRDTGRTLFILDEPTTGLHFHDIDLLLKVLHRLRDHGNTVVVIEHNLDVIKTADWIVDLGPEGGALGGHILVAGAPQDIVKNETSYTGRFLAPYLKNKVIQ
jgi:excinuclease ABC subunit A